MVIRIDQTEDEPTDSVRRDLASVRAVPNRPTFEQMLGGAERVRQHLKLPLIDHGELLYDEHGLPR